MHVTIGQHYTHYKRGGEYEIIHIGFLQSDTADDGKQVVVYKQLHDHPDYPSGTIWVRTAEMFLDIQLFQNKKTPRFRLVE